MKRKDKESDKTMADSTELDLQSSSDYSFVWDPQTHLYFHASSGFYHDPDAGWYYSSKYGLYYTFENGNYVLLDMEGAVADNSVLDEPCATASYNGPEYNRSSSQGNEVDAQNTTINVADESTSTGPIEDTSAQASEQPPPPSEWLEDTLIDLYLSGYNLAANSAADASISLETDEKENFKFPTDGNDEMYELDEGEWIPEESFGLGGSSEVVPYEGDTWDEENWRAQYGQVTRCKDEPLLEFPVVDLWDWSMVTKPKEDGKKQVARLIGRLVKRSAKVHPSVPLGGVLLKTAPICEVHLDLVRVRTGCTPSAIIYFRTSVQIANSMSKFKSRQKQKSEATREKGLKDLSMLSDQPSTSLKGSHAYRDRAAERRALRGGFGLGPGQKNAGSDHDNDPTCIEDAKAEALNMSFGADSYARRIMEGMGWKEGEALGNTIKGLTEPLQPTGNIGNAGLGWPQTRHR
ncbi:hypothetical protein ERO13_A03G091750v2 [Gossypium hirsutum]|uniref:Uncharacterized protein isoform X5 n=1 Tax=Gossypium hirsutum TaxID=3635 RepID=A0A1U8HL79_GOSHI|nr:uncharacterized protein LOC107887160 isoform X5 [Gossypium hirsutum]KAG4207782.1 hypothetical protein ERO13_A03G091750v2 [Gossypium hirsutum]